MAIADENSKIRLQVLLARAGVASRRASEELIKSGRVSVNGIIVTELGTRAGEGDRISLDGKPLQREERLRYLLLNKPPGFICAMFDPEGRPLAVSLIKKDVPERVYNIGRLDQWSSGLILFTNDGELAAILGHPSGGIEKEYEVIADGVLPDAFFDGLKQGIRVDGILYKALEARRTGANSGRVVLAEGKNREIRRILELFDRKARVLKRIRIGPLDARELPEASYRELTSDEVISLKTYGKRMGRTTTIRDASVAEGGNGTIEDEE